MGASGFKAYCLTNHIDFLLGGECWGEGVVCVCVCEKEIKRKRERE